MAILAQVSKEAPKPLVCFKEHHLFTVKKLIPGKWSNIRNMYFKLYTIIRKTFFDYTLFMKNVLLDNFF